MDRIVLDASAMLAALQQEPGGERVFAALSRMDGRVTISAVNFCEVTTKLVREGASRTEVHWAVEPFRRYVVEFDVAQAERAGEMYRETKALGLSLGDRVCLALAAATRATVWTTDRAWKKLKVGVTVELVRH